MKKPKFRLNAITVITAVTAIVCCVMIAKGIMLQPTIAANNKKAVQLLDEIEYEKQRHEEIDAMTEEADTDEYIEKIAREKLGMIKSDEIVFVDVSGQ